jgi:putative nucleotidyltransferase with HDIG domain
MKPWRRPLQSPGFEEMVNLSGVLRTIFHITIFALAIVSLNMTLGEFDNSSLSVLILFGLSLVFYLILRLGHHRLAGVGLLVAISLVMFYNFLIDGGLHDNGMVIFPVLILFAGLLLGKRTVVAMTLFILAEVTALYALTVRGVISPYGGVTGVNLQDLITVVILVLVAGVLIWLTLNLIEKNIIKIVESEERVKQSYDQTIDGWGKALELFDRETEGHSLRVTALTLEVAHRLAIQAEDLEHIRRGTLLHDIGKMGVPDDILNKPGPLTAEEREEIELHPWHTYRLLKNIPHIVKALEIPFCHHERWDGSGYPRKLKGEEIPLSARIFSIVDNWDALTSDRPYRKAWSREKVIEHLRAQSSHMFDPGLVELVIEVIHQQESAGMKKP